VIGEIDMGYDFNEYTPKNHHEQEEIGDDVYVIDPWFLIRLELTR